MISVINATIIGGIVLFGWGAFSWLALDLHRSTVSRLPNEEAVVASLKSHIAESGLYFFPQLPAEETDIEDWFARNRAGATGILLYHTDGHEAVTGAIMGRGFALHLATAFIVSWIVWLARESLDNLFKRLAFSVLIGVLIAIWADLITWNWMHYPAKYSLVNAAGHIFGMLLMGLPIAMIVKTEQNEDN